MSTRSEEPRPPTNDERVLARDIAAIAMRISGFMSEVAANEAQVSDLLVERMWEMAAFPLVTEGYERGECLDLDGEWRSFCKSELEKLRRATR